MLLCKRSVTFSYRLGIVVQPSSYLLYSILSLVSIVLIVQLAVQAKVYLRFDQLVARFVAGDQSLTDHTHAYPYSGDVSHSLVTYCYLIYIIPFVLCGVSVVIMYVTSRTRNVAIYAYPFVGMAAYGSLTIATGLGVKSGIMRPAPRQIEAYSIDQQTCSAAIYEIFTHAAEYQGCPFMYGSQAVTMVFSSLAYIPLLCFYTVTIIREVHAECGVARRCAITAAYMVVQSLAIIFCTIFTGMAILGSVFSGYAFISDVYFQILMGILYIPVGFFVMPHFSLEAETPRILLSDPSQAGQTIDELA